MCMQCIKTSLENDVATTGDAESAKLVEVIDLAESGDRTAAKQLLDDIAYTTSFEMWPEGTLIVTDNNQGGFPCCTVCGGMVIDEKRHRVFHATGEKFGQAVGGIVKLLNSF